MAASAGLRGPGGHGGKRRAAGEGDGDGRAEPELAGRGCRQGGDDEGVVLGFLHHETIVSETFDQLCVRANVADIKRLLSCAQAGVDFAKGKQCLDLHGCFPSFGELQLHQSALCARQMGRPDFE
jgi:hypothetical protein